MTSPPAFRVYGGAEYVLDYIMERKRVDDLHQSIKDRRYDKQKYNMQRCGLRHLVYLVEGDPDALGDEVGRAVLGSPTRVYTAVSSCLCWYSLRTLVMLIGHSVPTGKRVLHTCGSSLQSTCCFMHVPACPSFLLPPPVQYKVSLLTGS